MNPASNTKLLTFLASINSFDSIPSIKYFIENDTILNFKSTGFPLLLHPIYQDLNILRFFKMIIIWFIITQKKKFKI